MPFTTSGSYAVDVYFVVHSDRIQSFELVVEYISRRDFLVVELIRPAYSRLLPSKSQHNMEEYRVTDLGQSRPTLSNFWGWPFEDLFALEL